MTKPDILTDPAGRKYLDVTDDWRTWTSNIHLFDEHALTLVGARQYPEGVTLLLGQGDVGTEISIEDFRAYLPRIAAQMPLGYRQDTITARYPRDIDRPDQPVYRHAVVIELPAPTDEQTRPPLTTTPVALTDTAPDAGQEPAEPNFARFPYAWMNTADRHAYRLWVTTHAGRNPDPWPRPLAFPAVMTVASLTVITLAWSALALAAALLTWLAGSFHGVLSTAAASTAARIVTDPIHAYLTAHAGPLPAAAIYGGWQLWGVATLIIATIWRNTGARIGWTLFGAASIYMVWRGTSLPSQPIAAGIAAMWWTTGALIAFRHRWTTPKIIAQIPGLGQRRDGTIVNATRAANQTIQGLIGDMPTPGTLTTPNRHPDINQNPLLGYRARRLIIDIIRNGPLGGMCAADIADQFADRTGSDVDAAALIDWLDDITADPDFCVTAPTFPGGPYRYDPDTEPA